MSLQDRRIGIIGAGVMGGALCRGLVSAGVVPPQAILVSDMHKGHLQNLQDAVGVAATSHNEEVASFGDVVILAVKPQTIHAILAQIAPVLESHQLLVSIAAGVRIPTIESALGKSIPVVRAMPNTPAQVHAGACAFCRGTYANDTHVEWTLEIFRSVGEAVEVDERMMDAVTALSGSGPAYVYLMIEALVDGGVKVGLPRDLAHQLAAQTVLGAAQMVIQTGRHPAELKDMVATPSGTTITALAALEQAGFRAALIDAVERAAIRSAELGQ